ncbi:hypothetical protein N658DRAFT_270935 [Parathielavia hyrcaniae]|uniref:Uncharacterized protein n=1 Tax=Parathielavia hyrcaniae TaxID=113614 RepID=A0AAN6PTB2_9PEZI|nr:hypothetical protein N658DRAFT_270935 [Parathielavia hyrcaniae]
MPVVFRVLYTPKDSRLVRFAEVHSTKLVGPQVTLDPATSEMTLIRWEVTYVLMAVIRHRDEHRADLARFYGDTGLYIMPPLVDGRAVDRPFESNGWGVEDPDATYTLIYARGPGTWVSELGAGYIPKERHLEDEETVKAFEGFNDCTSGLPVIPAEYCATID